MKLRSLNSERSTLNTVTDPFNGRRSAFGVRRFFFLLLLTASPLAADDAAWRSYAVYQPTVEHAFVCDAMAQPLRYNHDSSAAWFGGRWFCVWNANAIPEEGAPGQLNYVSTSPDGLVWSAPRAAFSDSNLCVNPAPCPKGTQWQPNLIVVKDQLWAVWSQNSKDEHNGCYLSVLSAPDGKWSNRLLKWEGRADPVIDGKPFRLFPTQNPTRLSTGRILAPVTMMGPVSASAPAGKSGWQWLEKRNSVIYTDDGGATWQVSPGTVLPGLDWRQWEPTVFEQPDGSVMMFARNNMIPSLENATILPAETLTRSVSHDGGATWSPQTFVPLQTVVSRMHVERQGATFRPSATDRFLMIHNDWPVGTFGSDRRNLALFVNRGGGMDFAAGVGLTDAEREVAYPQMAQHGDSLLISYSQGPCALRNIKSVRVSPLPDPNRFYLYPRSNLPAAPQCTLTNGTLLLGGGLFLKCRTAPAVTPSGLSAEAWVNPDDNGVLFDNRDAAGGFVWAISGTCFVHLGEPAKNLRSSLPVPRGRWSRVGLALNYAKGEVVFLVNGQSERVTFKPGHRSMSGASATLFGPNPASSRLTAFEGSLRSLTLDGTNRLFDAADPAAFQSNFLLSSGGGGSPGALSATGTSQAACSVLVVVRDGKPVLRFTGAASAGVELGANERAAGDTVELAFDFLVERGEGQTLCTVGDANQPARVLVRGTRILLSANGQTQACGSAAPGAWQRLALTTRDSVTRVTLNDNPPAEVRHAPQATWLYLGEGYLPATPAGDAALVIDIASVRSRVTRPQAHAAALVSAHGDVRPPWSMPECWRASVLTSRKGTYELR